jgi:hypothetical protein
MKTCKKLTLEMMVNQNFSRLTVISKVNGGGVSRFLCKCACGNTKVIDGFKLRNGHTKSCGCLMRETASQRMKKHGLSNTRLHTIWGGMIGRTSSQNKDKWGLYVGRGISVCEKWKNFINFYNDMLPSYQYASNIYGEKNISLDRINNNGNYCKKNCKWSTRKQQMRNMRKNVYFTFNQKRLTIPEWSEITGIKQCTIRSRIYRGWTHERVLSRGNSLPRLSLT